MRRSEAGYDCDKANGSRAPDPRLEELMAKTAADNLCERLLEWNVTTIYGFPGDGINGILGALRRHQDRLRFVQTRHVQIGRAHV